MLRGRAVLGGCYDGTPIQAPRQMSSTLTGVSNGKPYHRGRWTMQEVRWAMPKLLCPRPKHGHCLARSVPVQVRGEAKGLDSCTLNPKPDSWAWLPHL